MTPRDFYEFLAIRTISGTIDFGDVIKLRVGRQDSIAGKLLLWLVDTMPDDTTIGDLDDVLDSAKWWHTFWVSLARDDTKEDETQ